MMQAIPAAAVYQESKDGVASYLERRRQWERMHVYGMQFLDFKEKLKPGYPNFCRGPCARCGAITVIFILLAKSEKWSLCTMCADDDKAGDWARKVVSEACGVGTAEQAARDFRAMLNDVLPNLTRKIA